MRAGGAFGQGEAADRNRYSVMLADDDPNLLTPMTDDEVTRRFAELNRKA